MTPLHGLATAVIAQEKREPSREPGDPDRALDLYAAWKAIFESAGPSAVQTPRSPADRLPGADDNGVVQVRSLAFPVARTLESRAAGTPTWTRPRPAFTKADPSCATSKPQKLEGQNVLADVVPLARQTASAATREVANVSVRVHYLGADSARSAGGPQPEVVSIILEGAQVSIIVRNGNLSETEALRTAFDTARELTGSPSSLQQLTLNGRVLYEQAIRGYVAPGAFLFA
jgi:hypothetical protein